MSNCPCCSTPLLRHISHHQVYWFCPSCRQEMPDWSSFVQTKALLKRVKADSRDLELVPS